MAGGLCCLIVAALIGGPVYVSSDSSLQTHLQGTGICPTGAAMCEVQPTGRRPVDSALVLMAGWLALVFSGQFGGPRAKWGFAVFGTLLVFDGLRRHPPWISYWDADYKYRP